MREHTINLTFHGVGEPGSAVDPEERNVWVTESQFVSVLDAAAPRDDVSITFDDGNVSDVAYALPRLAERGLSATFFVVAGKLGTPGFLDVAGVRTLAQAGMEVGCHGMRHRPWRGLGADMLREELVDARNILQRVAGRPITRAACPFGSYDRRVLGALRSCGYEHVYTSDRGTARPSDFLQARNTVRCDDGPGLLGSIAALESAGYRSLPRRAKLKVKQWR